MLGDLVVHGLQDRLKADRTLSMLPTLRDFCAD